MVPTKLKIVKNMIVTFDIFNHSVVKYVENL